MQIQLIFKFIQFRFDQLARAFKEAGYFRVIFFAIFLIVAVVGFSKLIIKRNLLLIPIYLVLCSPFHLSRKDQSFLRKLAIPTKVVWATEYNLIVFPFTMLLVFNQQWSVALLGHILVTLIIFIPNSFAFKQRSVGEGKIIAYIPEHLFEWKSYFRKKKITFLIYYFLTACLSFSLYAVLIGIIVLLAFLPEVYNHLEPKELIETYPGKFSFLWSKLKDHSIFIHLLFLPLYLLFAAFHYQFWYLLISLILLAELSISFGLLYKYSQIYIACSNVHNQFPFAIFFIASILFFPIGCFFIYLYWVKAQKKLTGYVRN